MIKIPKNETFIFLSVLFAFVFVPYAYASEIFFGVHNASLGIGSIFEVGVFLKTEGQNINAVEGRIVFPNDLVELREVRDGNSMVSLWVKKPEATPSPEATASKAGEVFFSGLVPGGFIGEDGYLFSLFFEAKQKGQARITAADEQILLNDGQGSKDLVKQAPLVLSIEDVEKVNELPPFNDGDSPESFTPQVSRDPSIFDGKWFLVFATEDKGSGIDHYEIQETSEKRSFDSAQGEQETNGWTKAESPYLLQDQSLKRYIYVRAVDKAGNERIEMIAPQNPAKWYESYAIWIIISGIACILGLIGRILWRKKGQRAK